MATKPVDLRLLVDAKPFTPAAKGEALAGKLALRKPDSPSHGHTSQLYRDENDVVIGDRAGQDTPRTASSGRLPPLSATRNTFNFFPSFETSSAPATPSKDAVGSSLLIEFDTTDDGEPFAPYSSASVSSGADAPYAGFRSPSSFHASAPAFVPAAVPTSPTSVPMERAPVMAFPRASGFGPSTPTVAPGAPRLPAVERFASPPTVNALAEPFQTERVHSDAWVREPAWTKQDYESYFGDSAIPLNWDSPPVSNYSPAATLPSAGSEDLQYFDSPITVNSQALTAGQYGMFAPPGVGLGIVMSQGQTVAGAPLSVASSDDAEGPAPNSRKPGLYKSELCRAWEERGSCRYGRKCQFAHGRHELRSVQRNAKYKTEVCRAYFVNGTCSYGNRCLFIHTTPAVKSSEEPAPTDEATRRTSSSSSASGVSFSNANTMTRLADYFSSPPGNATPSSPAVSVADGNPVPVARALTSDSSDLSVLSSVAASPASAFSATSKITLGGMAEENARSGLVTKNPTEVPASFAEKPRSRLERLFGGSLPSTRASADAQSTGYLHERTRSMTWNPAQAMPDPSQTVVHHPQPVHHQQMHPFERSNSSSSFGSTSAHFGTMPPVQHKRAMMPFFNATQPSRTSPSLARC